MRPLVGSSFLLAVLGCSTPSPSVNLGPGDGAITIATAASYTWSGIANEGFAATLANRSGEKLYAAIGDGFAGPVQELLYIANGADAVFERETKPGTWTEVETGVLVEGARVVELAPGVSHPLTGLPTFQIDGTYRIRLRYYSNQEQTGTARETVSNGFVIR